MTIKIGAFTQDLSAIDAGDANTRDRGQGEPTPTRRYIPLADSCTCEVGNAAIAVDRVCYVSHRVGRAPSR